jgi:hypothetical protein
LVGRHCHFDFDLGQETDRLFGAAIDFPHGPSDARIL